MSSDRPRTPPRSTWEQSESLPNVPEDSKPSENPSPVDTEYPLADIIYPLREALFVEQTGLPSIYLQPEAVDASLRLGEGASFTASLQHIPKEFDDTKGDTHDNRNNSTKQRDSVVRPQYLVYKVARIAFDENGQTLPEYRKAFQSVLTEIHALVNPPLRKHANIIDFLGVAFGSSPFSPSHRLPAVVVEYAQHGTLAKVLDINRPMAIEMKQQLALDVARGISALHKEGLVHGDVKTENVLICSHPTRVYTAKIADFGFSVVEATETGQILMGGTRPWKAPETKDPTPVSMLSFTDVFSFGLLVWTICIDGRSPFDLLYDQVPSMQQMDEIKSNGDLLRLGQQLDWILSYLRLALGIEDQLLPLMSIDTRNGVTSNTGRPVSLLRDPEVLEQFEGKAVIQQALRFEIWRSIDDILALTINPQPELRSLGKVIKILEGNANERGNSIIPTPQNRPGEVPASKYSTALGDSTENRWSARGFKRNLYSWQKVRDMDPGIQNIIFENLNSSYGPLQFFRSSLLMNGYGCESNTVEALKFLERAAHNGSTSARAYLHRLWLASRVTYESGPVNPGTKYLHDYALMGSKPALEEYKKVHSTDEVEKLKRLISDTSGGVGAPWLKRSEMLDSHTQSQWINDEWLMERVRSATVPPSKLTVNKRGDTVLHFVAMCGRWKPFKALIEEYRMDVNLRNPLGETPLLCAMRAGQGGIVIMCLKNCRADASIAANNGETPLHWLLSHEDQYIPFIVKDLLSNRASIDAVTREAVSHGMFGGSIDVEFQSAGSPLLWAVHDNRPAVVKALLQNGADPTLGETQHGIGNFAPLKRAAYLHHHECLKLIIEHLESTVTQRTSSADWVDNRRAFFGALIHQCVHAADRFSMMLRGGVDYLNRLHRTLELLREKTAKSGFQASFEGSLLYFAVSGAHDEVVEYMFQHNWETETLNWPSGPLGRTPLLEAVRWNRKSIFQLLADRDADVRVLAVNPFQTSVRNWSALHIFAQEGHNRDLTLAHKLADAIPVDGFTTASPTTHGPVKQGNDIQSDLSALNVKDDEANGLILPCETPLVVALRRNAFDLCSKLLSIGANANALFYSSNMFSSTYPLTVLGHVIISNARYSAARLQYFMNRSGVAINFIVEPARRLTALHRAAMAHQDIHKITGGEVPRHEFDFETNENILYELLLKWKGNEDLNAKCAVRGNTALHLAVEAENLGAVESLLKAGADKSVTNDGGYAPLRLAEGGIDKSPLMEQIRNRLA